jgi:isocitrate dehydrogenase kinase/phosphatase
MRWAHNPAFAMAVRAGQCAQRIAEGFLAVDAGLRALARRAPERFRDGDWQGSQFDTDENLQLRQREIEATLLDLARSCGNELRQLEFWREVRRHYLSLIDGLPDTTFCRLFFNELVAETLGDDARLGRLTLDVSDVDEVSAADLRITELGTELPGGLRRVLDSLPLEAAWLDADACATRVAQELRARLPELDAVAGATLTLLDATFYRFTRAYVFGRIACQDRQLPLALALRNTADGVVVEHIMLDGAEIGVLFGRRACFQVELEQVAGSLAFLQSLTPATPAAALLAGLGRTT